MHILFLHGLESGPQGSKFQSIRAAGWNVTAPDCAGVTNVETRVEIARAALAARAGPVVLVGSSFGGLTAARLHAALAGSAAGEAIHGLLLLAPAFHLGPLDGLAPAHRNTIVLHGVLDDVVPIDTSRSYAARFECPLVEVEDGHRLADSHAEILRLLERVAGSNAGP